MKVRALLAAWLVLSACPGGEPGVDAGLPDSAQHAAPDAAPAADAGRDAQATAPDASSPPRPDAAEPGPDAAAARDAAPVEPPDAASGGLDAAGPGLDASAPDGGGMDSWTDPATGLEWMQTNLSGDLDWDGASRYCADFGGGWRLPTLDELRTTVVDCLAAEAGGTCPAGSGCLATSCATTACRGCGNTGACHRAPVLMGACEPFWSSSLAPDRAAAWSVNFYFASISAVDLETVLNFRCVR